ncbi:ATP phosphoribosyltransferase regulatory subunit [Sphingomonas sp. LaA6.9]|uniref:ATP phosphoribosyltransferase regulatory subunit n=1 Tax=Sphingomonas sp. LaA6.9 TaxID=2919914 RepID=UPI001F4FC6D2|nr:ATP phosphoribosyltransferase regulatory subunit [Sphingomonas sp. LaA6.9]MCJ8156270.1 ATP phosphoribosyltransferase regulatory subunit [Sphingomonas sp. LaA6.9]
MIPPGLLPEGFRDRLPPEAEAIARLVRRVLDTAAAHGYERVSPPLAEFEAGLVGRLKSTRAQDLLRFVDPVSQRTMAVRPDITAQVGRIAATRMAHHPRPVRLAYGGSVLKLKATQLRPEREMMQVGAELIGLDSVAAAREIVSVAIEALGAAGVSGITVDFTLPNLVETLAQGPLAADPVRVPAIRALLDAKDAGGLSAAGAEAFLPLVEAAGPFEAAIRRLRGFAGGAIASRLDALEAIAAPLGAGVALTLDPTERHGFEYQSWFGFSLFAEGVSGEIGRGGSYTIVHEDGREEPAIGFSIYCDPLVDAGLTPHQRKRLFVPMDTDPAIAAKMRAEGWVTVAALTADDTPAAQICSHILKDGAPVPA